VEPADLQPEEAAVLAFLRERTQDDRRPQSNAGAHPRHRNSKLERAHIA
jgi:hypothetical protein